MALGWSGRWALYYESGLCRLPRKLPKPLKRETLGRYLMIRNPCVRISRSVLLLHVRSFVAGFRRRNVEIYYGVSS